MTPKQSSWTAALHVALLVALSAAFESVFLRRGLNPMDEGWPLYAAMQLHAGGHLYRDVFWVFPPGHVFAAWVAYALSPPGLYLARVFYAAFAVALCVALYLLGRRITTPGFAFLGAALVAVAAPVSHSSHLMFGYRYLVWSALALWCFSERLRTGRAGWMAAAGAATGMALVFRIDPPVAAAAGIGLGLLSLRPPLRVLVRDAGAYALGFAAVFGPVFLYFLARVGPEALWVEVVARPMAMHQLQGLPLPSLEWPARVGPWTLRVWFVALQFRLWTALYVGYALFLGVRLARSLLARRPFDQPLLLAVAVWGGLFYSRSLIGRSDEPHLDSAIPPALLLLAHAVGAAASRVRFAPARAAIGAAVFVAWVWLTAVPRYPAYLDRAAVPVEELGGATLFHPRGNLWDNFDDVVRAIRSETGPEDTVLDLTASPLFHVASGRRGPGWADLVMPGTFLRPEEELAMIERLEGAPPALVITSRRFFDRDVTRSPIGIAPRLWEWVERRYAERRVVGRFVLHRPRDAKSR
jgi:hypothetical protein